MEAPPTPQRPRSELQRASATFTAPASNVRISLPNWLTKPYVALLIFVAANGVALLFSRADTQLTWAMPFAWQGDPAPKFLLLVACPLAIYPGRIWPKVANASQAAIGAMWLFYTTHWPYAIGLIGILCIAHWIAPRLRNDYMAFGLTALLLIVLSTFTFRVQTGVNFLVSGWMTVRICAYAFEARAIPKRRRSLVSALAYGPFNLFLAPENPLCFSYLGYTSTARSQSELDKLGAWQLYRSTLKALLFVVFYVALRRALPLLADFERAPVLVRAAVFVVTGYWGTYLAISASCDFSTSLCNFGGHYAPDAFHFPFLAKTPFEQWRRWNIHVLDFLRVFCILPLARKRAKLTVVVAAGMAVSIGLHVLFMSTGSGLPELLPALQLETTRFALLTIMTLLFVPLELRRIDAGLIGLILTQIPMIATSFSDGRGYFFPFEPVSYEEGICYARAVVSPHGTCASSIVLSRVTMEACTDQASGAPCSYTIYGNRREGRCSEAPLLACLPTDAGRPYFVEDPPILTAGTTVTVVNAVNDSLRDVPLISLNVYDEGLSVPSGTPARILESLPEKGGYDTRNVRYLLEIFTPKRRAWVDGGFVRVREN